jgi:hypothetical protein
VVHQFGVVRLHPLSILAYLTLPRLETRRRAVLGLSIAVGTSVAVYLWGQPLPQWGSRPFRELVVVVPTFFAGMAVSSLTQLLGPPRSRAVTWLPESCVLAALMACYLPGVWPLAVLLVAMHGLVFALACLGAASRKYWWFLSCCTSVRSPTRCT